MYFTYLGIVLLYAVINAVFEFHMTFSELIISSGVMMILITLSDIREALNGKVRPN